MNCNYFKCKKNEVCSSIKTPKNGSHYSLTPSKKYNSFDSV